MYLNAAAELAVRRLMTAIILENIHTCCAAAMAHRAYKNRFYTAQVFVGQTGSSVS